MREDTLGKEEIQKSDEEYFYAPHLQSIEFYSHEYGIEDPAKSHFNQTHAFILGMTPYSLVELPYFKKGAHVQCFTQMKSWVGRTFKY